MSGQYRTSPSCLCATAVIALIAVGMVGCLPLLAKAPTVSGRWTGRIILVTVYDQNDNSYDATALEIIDGPLPRRSIDPKKGGGRLPLLAVGYDNGYRIANPARLPVGQIVEAQGTMLGFSVNVDLPWPTVDATVTRHRAAQRQSGEHILLLRYKPKVVTE